MRIETDGMHGATPNDGNGKKRRMEWDPLDMNSNVDIGPSDPKQPNLSCTNGNDDGAKERDRRQKNTNGKLLAHVKWVQSKSIGTILWSHCGRLRLTSQRKRGKPFHQLCDANCRTGFCKITTLSVHIIYLRLSVGHSTRTRESKRNMNLRFGIFIP